MAPATKPYTFTASTRAVASEVNQNFDDVLSFLNNSVAHLDGSKTFTAYPQVSSGTNFAELGGTYLAPKSYVDAATPFAGAKAHRTTNQSIANATWTGVSMSSSESWDSDDFHDLVTNPSRFTIPTGLNGKYRFNMFAQFAANGNGGRWLGYNVDGGGWTSVQCVDDWGASVFTMEVNASIELNLSVASYFEFGVYQTSGGALNVANAWCSCQKIG